jgi:hypothetical protein
VIRVKKLPEPFGVETPIHTPGGGIVLLAFRLVKSSQTVMMQQEFRVFVELFLIDGSESFGEQRGPGWN